MKNNILNMKRYFSFALFFTCTLTGTQALGAENKATFKALSYQETQEQISILSALAKQIEESEALLGKYLKQASQTNQPHSQTDAIVAHRLNNVTKLFNAVLTLKLKSQDLDALEKLHTQVYIDHKSSDKSDQNLGRMLKVSDEMIQRAQALIKSLQVWLLESPTYIDSGFALIPQIITKLNTISADTIESKETTEALKDARALHADLIKFLDNTAIQKFIATEQGRKVLKSLSSVITDFEVQHTATIDDVYNWMQIHLDDTYTEEPSLGEPENCYRQDRSVTSAQIEQVKESMIKLAQTWAEIRGTLTQARILINIPSYTFRTRKAEVYVHETQEGQK